MLKISALDVDVATQALQYVSQYDAMRLETYRRKENLADRITVAPIASATALRFDDVGYFNRVYCTDSSTFDALEEIEEFYREEPFGCELVAPPVDSSVEERTISRSGWAQSGNFAWLHMPDCGSFKPIQTSQLEIRPPAPSQREEFLTAYLTAFGAEQDRFPAAIRNMRHLFDQPELDFLMARHGNRLAGVAMMMRCGDKALLCAGAALPEFREMGCHAALLDARIRLAAESGCREVYSWAFLGGQSHSNLEKAGLSMVGTSNTWRFSPESQT